MATDSRISNGALRQATIVIIDDEPGTLNVLTRTLNSQGFANVRSTAEPREAVEFCRTCDPDLIILDLFMPGISGFDLLKEIRTQTRDDCFLPVLIMTGDPRSETKRTALASGATDFVTKPFDPTEIVLRTSNLLEMRLLHQGLSQQNERLEIAVRERTAALEAEIAERRHVEESLRLAETKYRTMLEDAVFGVFQVDPNGKIITVNSALARLGGYESPEELKTSVSNVFAELCVDSEQLREFLRLVHDQGSVNGFEGPLYRKDGSVMWTSTSARVVRDRNGEVQYYEGTLEDISKRKQAEAALASANQELEIRVQQRTAELTQANEEILESHRRLEAVLSATPVLIWTTDRHGVLTFAAGKVCSLIGRQPHQLVGHSVFRLYGDHPQIVANHERVLKGELINSMVEVNDYIFDARHEPLWNSAGEVEGVLGVAVDVTEKKRAEAVLREQKEVLQTIFDHSPVMVSLWDANGRFRLANREWEQVLGWSTPEARAEPDLFARFYPDPAAYQRVIAFINNPGGAWMDCRTVVRDGRVVDTSWTSVPLSDGTRIGFGVDISARKRAEKELQSRLRQQAAVAAFGQEALAGGEIEALFNRAATLLSETLEVEYSAIAELLPDGDSVVFRAAVGWQGVPLGHTAVRASENTYACYVLQSREPVIVKDFRTETRFISPPLIHEHGILSGMSVAIGSLERPFGVLCANTSSVRQFTQEDVIFLQTVAHVLASAIERSRTDETIRNSKDEAERANRAKSEFLSRMSHELRTPLNAILGFAQLLELEEQFTGEIRDNVEQIIKGGRHLLELINEVLDIARIEAGKFALSLEAVNAQEAIEEALRLVAPLATKYGVTLESSPAGTDMFLLADRQRIRQVLLNLLSNAIKYNRDFGWVRVFCEFSSQTMIRISVQDTGDGIAAENLPKLFTPFERLGMDQRDVEGSGIGLALSKRLVELMDGKIGVESVVREGSTFWIELPAAENPLDYAEVTGHLTQQRAVQAHSYTLLHIEDNLSNLKLIERVLVRRPDIRLIAAIQGQLGIQLAREHHPDLILLDLHLPDINGDEVLRRLRTDAATREIPVVMLSADATPGQIERLLAAGACEYLTKPLDVPRFLDLLNQLVGDNQKNE